MNIDEIRQGFLDAYNFHERLITTVIPDPPRRYKYKIFPFLFLEDLKTEIQRLAYQDKTYNEFDDDFNHNYGARFIVDMGNEIKFSLEGPRSSSVPVHTDLATRVLTAGNIYFSEDYSKIVGISNKSGHFRPDFSTLVFAIPLILSSEFPLADLIQVKDEDTGESIALSKTEWMDLLPSELIENLPQILELNTCPDNQIFVDQSYSETQVAEEENVIVPLIPMDRLGFFTSEEFNLSSETEKVEEENFIVPLMSVGRLGFFTSEEFNLSSETEKVEEENVIGPLMPVDRLSFFTSEERNSSNPDIFKTKRARINIQCD